jgi:hypothetical protein
LHRKVIGGANRSALNPRPTRSASIAAAAPWVAQGRCQTKVLLAGMAAAPDTVLPGMTTPQTLGQLTDVSGQPGPVRRRILLHQHNSDCTARNFRYMLAPTERGFVSVSTQLNATTALIPQGRREAAAAEATSRHQRN